MPRGQGIYDSADEPDGDDRGGRPTSAGDVDTDAATPDVAEPDGDTEPTA